MSLIDNTGTELPIRAAHPAVPDLPIARPSRATLIGTMALVLWPVAAAIAATFSRPVEASLDPAADPAGQVAAQLAAIAAHPGPWAGFGLGMMVMALLVGASVPAVWRLTVERTPVWAWASAVLGALFFMGLSVHLMSWVVVMKALATAEIDPAAAMSVIATVEGDWFFWVIFVPFLAGVMLAPLVAAVALLRARVIPLRSLVAVLLATVLQAVVGTAGLWQAALYAGLMLAGSVPALVTVVRRRREV